MVGKTDAADFRIFVVSRHEIISPWSPLWTRRLLCVGFSPYLQKEVLAARHQRDSARFSFEADTGLRFVRILEPCLRGVNKDGL
jgi:hypothetical protein